MPTFWTPIGSKGTIAALVIGLILLSSHTAFCDGDGNELLSQCNTAIAMLDDAKGSSDPTNTAHMGFCFGLMRGVMGLNGYYQNLYNQIEYKGVLLFCIPESGIRNGQAARIVIKHMNEHPERLHENAIGLVFTAFVEAFPCK